MTSLPPIKTSSTNIAGQPLESSPAPNPEHPGRTKRFSLVGEQPASPRAANDEPGKAGTFSKIVNELGRRLSARIAREDLLDKNIIKDEGTTTPSYTAAKQALEKEREKDKLSHKLQRRPTQTDLKMRNILQSDPNAAGTEYMLTNGEVPSRKAAKFEERKTQLKSILKHRPERSELENQNIIKTSEGVDPAIAVTAERVRRAQLEDQLEHMIRDRPKPQEITARGINFNETVLILPTFRSNEYNRKPENDMTFKKLTPKLKMAIRDELNEYKKSEMSVHEASTQNTCFH